MKTWLEKIQFLWIGAIFLSMFMVTKNGNAQSFEWANAIGGTLYTVGLSISVDNSGNVYTAGGFYETVDFDPGVGTAYLTALNGDIFIQKLDESGNFLWAKSFGFSGADFFGSSCIDAFGNVYTVGSFQGITDFDPGIGIFNLNSIGGFEIFIQKLDSLGNFVWAKALSGIGSDYSASITADTFGNIFITGRFERTIDFDPGIGTAYLSSTGSTSSGGYPDAFVLKMDASGNFLWAKSFGGLGTDAGHSISVDHFGNVFTSGTFEGIVDFDPGEGTTILSAPGSSKCFIQKLDALGNFLWAKAFNITNVNQFNFISSKVDITGNVLTAGYFQGSADFDLGTGTTNLSSVGSHDIFVQKMDTDGNFLWAKSFGGASSDQAYDLDVDVSGNVYTTGRFNSTADFDPGIGTAYLNSAGITNVFVQKMDASGNFLWARSLGGEMSAQANSICIDSNSNIYTTGTFSGTADFDPNGGTSYLTSTGNYDAFVHKMSNCAPILTTDVVSTCNNYTWINGVNYTASNITATHTIANAAGCDSLVTLNLTINTVSDTTIILSDLILTSMNDNATYQWLDCDNNNVAIVGATNQNYTVTSSGNYAVELAENGCVDTSSCASIVILGSLEKSFEKTIILMPNPTEGSVFIDFGMLNKKSLVTISDVFGKVVYINIFFQAQLISLSIDEPAGVYFVCIQSDDKQAIFKLVKE